MNMTTTIAHFKGKYLNTTEAFIHQQLTGITHFRSLMLCLKKENLDLYPFSPLYSLSDLSTGRKLVEFFKFLTMKHSDYFESVVKEQNARLIHVHFGHSGKYFLKLKDRLKIPLITTFYGVDIGKPPKFYSGLFKNGDLFIALSNDMKKKLSESGCTDEKIKVWHLGIDTDKIKYRRKERGGKFLFLTVARFVEKKGIEYGIKAFAKVAKQYPESELRIVGDGPLYSKFIRIARELGIAEKVIFINNFVSKNPRKTVMDEFDRADAFLLPSISIPGDYGGTPIVLLESQAYGIPTITTDDCGGQEEVLDGKTGFIVPQRDIGGLAQRMIDLIKDPELCAVLGRNGRRHIENEFDQKIQMIKLEKIYTDMLGIRCL